jgi:hypothetical protein
VVAKPSSSRRNMLICCCLLTFFVSVCPSLNSFAVPGVGLLSKTAIDSPVLSLTLVMAYQVSIHLLKAGLANLGPFVATNSFNI